MKRRVLIPLTAVGVLLTVTAPAGASESTGGWEPAPSPAWSYPAGARCDFAVQGSPVVDEVVQRTLATEEDGTKLVEYKGELVVRIVNSETGASYDADASGRAVVEIRPDRSQSWYVVGPILAGFGEGGGNVPRGLYTVDGAYTLEVSATGYKTLKLIHGTSDPLCSKVS